MFDVATLRRLTQEVGRAAAQAANAEDAVIEHDGEAAAGFGTVYGLLVSARFALEQATGVLEVTARNARGKVSA